ncbi:MAG TPA: signal peptidase II [Kofleriaceae bacterium]|jgi:signal peptidase II
MPKHLVRAAGFVIVFLLSTGFDQASKQWALNLPVPAGCSVPADLVAHRCSGIPQPVVAGHWDWELSMNTGAAFSSLDHGAWSQVLLALLAFGAIGVIGVMVVRTRPEQHLERIAYGLIAGGALGNVIDRLRHGGVTDFVRWRWGSHDWPIFNVADAALLVGVVVLLAARAFRHRARAQMA